MTDSAISIYCRFRPETMREKAQLPRKNLKIALKTGDDRAIETSYRYSSIGSPTSMRITKFAFDRVFWQLDTPQSVIYEETARQAVKHFLGGGSAAVFAYGNPASGKTYTMFGPDMNSDTLQGILPRCCIDIFDNLPHDDDAEFTVTCSFVEVYNESLRDLLDPTAPLTLFETEEGVQIENLTELIVTDAFEVVDLVREGERFRNTLASKAHSVCIISIIKRVGEEYQKASLFLVDLCGSSNRASLGAERINPSLTVLGNCLVSLGNRSQVPYADSKLTLLLREIFVRPSKISLVVTCSPHSGCVEETIDALRYAEKIKKISLEEQPQVENSNNEEIDAQYGDTVIENLKRDLEIANQKIQWMMKNTTQLNLDSFDQLPGVPGSPKSPLNRRDSDSSQSSQLSQISERSEGSMISLSQEVSQNDSPPGSENSSFLGNFPEEEPSEEDKKASQEYPGGMSDGDFRKFSMHVWNLSFNERDKIVAKAASVVKLTCWQLSKLLSGIIHVEEKDTIGQILVRSVVDPENYEVVKEVSVQRLLRGLCKRSSILLTTNNQSTLKLKTRQLVLNEIINTERDYVKDLELIIKIYLEPLDKQGILSRTETQEIFSNISVLSSVNKQFLHEFSTNPNVGEVFMQTANMLKIYTEYCVNHPKGWETLKRCIRKNQKLALFLKEVGYDPNIRGLDLFSFLIKPVQRLCKYPLLVKELLNNTPESHSEYEDLRKAYEKINTVVDYINEKKREAEALTSMKRIAAIEGCERIGLIRHGREVIAEGSFIYTHKKKTRPGRVILLNDMILIISNKKDKLKLKWHQPIQQIRVTNMADSKGIKNSFILIDRDDPKLEFTITCNSDTEKATWMERIAGLVREYQKRRMLSSNSSSILNPPPTLRQIADMSMSRSSDNLMYRPTSPGPASPAIPHHVSASAPTTPNQGAKSASHIGSSYVSQNSQSSQGGAKAKPVTPPAQRGFTYLAEKKANSNRGSRSLSEPMTATPEPISQVTLTPVGTRKMTARGPPPVPPSRDANGNPTYVPPHGGALSPTGATSPPSPSHRDDPTVPTPRPPMSPRPPIKYAVRVKELNVKRMMQGKNPDGTTGDVTSPPANPSNPTSPKDIYSSQ